ncbi:MAG: hypothetical protein LUC16_01200, partial [Coprobacillus sp.]|nr:hypothetical protein [Coprobacillus sp.]
SLSRNESTLSCFNPSEWEVLLDASFGKAMLVDDKEVPDPHVKTAIRAKHISLSITITSSKISYNLKLLQDLIAFNKNLK